MRLANEFMRMARSSDTVSGFVAGLYPASYPRCLDKTTTCRQGNAHSPPVKIMRSGSADNAIEAADHPAPASCVHSRRGLAPGLTAKAAIREPANYSWLPCGLSLRGATWNTRGG